MLWQGVCILVDRAKHGDPDALNGLCRLVQPYLLRLAQKVLGTGWPDKSISDLTQETWVRAWQGIGGFRGANNDEDTGALLRAWLAQTMKNVWHNQQRFDNAQCRKPSAGFVVALAAGIGKDTSHAEQDPAAHDPTPSQNLRAKEQLALLERAVGNLNEECDRDIVRLRFFNGMSFGEIGEQLGRDESTIRYRLQRILEFLGNELKDLE